MQLVQIAMETYRSLRVHVFSRTFRNSDQLASCITLPPGFAAIGAGKNAFHQRNEGYQFLAFEWSADR